MNPGDKEYDIVIVGKRHGGLVCAAILQGRIQCLRVEKEQTVGRAVCRPMYGTKLFWLRVHYIGGLEPGSEFIPDLKYPIFDSLHLQRMDVDCFDKIMIGDDPVEYPLITGLRKFYRSVAGSIFLTKKMRFVLIVIKCGSFAGCFLCTIFAQEIFIPNKQEYLNWMRRHTLPHSPTINACVILAGNNAPMQVLEINTILCMHWFWNSYESAMEMCGWWFR